MRFMAYWAWRRCNFTSGFLTLTSIDSTHEFIFWQNRQHLRTISTKKNNRLIRLPKSHFRKLALLIVVVFAFLPGKSQFRKYSNEFLNIGAGARGLAMGGAQVSSVGDATAGYWNPAGLTDVKDYPVLSIMHAEYFAGIGKYDYASLAIPIGDPTIRTRTIGFSLMRFAVDDIPNTLFLVEPDGTVNYNNIRSFSSADYAFLFSYAQVIYGDDDQTFSFGTNAKVIHRNVGSFAKAWGLETHVEEKIAMGHLMLRVSPEAKYDQQPVRSECGRYLLVGHFRLDYRDELGDKLGIIQSELELTPDSILVMLAYQKWKDQCVHHIEGDWAFALFDRASNSLMLAKDRTGYSALFYTVYQGAIYFSSDVNVIGAIEAIPFEVDMVQFYRISLPSILVERGKTLLKEVYHLNGGEYLIS